MNNKVDYKTYIKSKEWRNKRQKLFNLKGKECEQCGSQNNIHVHHKTYERLGNEDLDDLQILCYQCHMSKHDSYFNKYILEPAKKKQIEIDLKNKRINKIRSEEGRLKGKKIRKEKLLNADWNTLSIREKRKRLRLKGWKV